MTSKKIAKEFRRLLREALSTSGRTMSQKHFHDANLSAFINSQSSADAYEVMFDIYMQEYFDLEINNDKDASYISAHVFVQLFEGRINKATYYDPFVQTCMEALIYKTALLPPKFGLDTKAISPIGESIIRRFGTLSNRVLQLKIIDILKTKQKDKKNSLSLFEILIDIFWSRTGRFPDSDDELFYFDPKRDAGLSKLHETQASLISAFQRRDFQGLELALRTFAKMVSQSKDMESSFQFFNWCRRFVVDSESSQFRGTTVQYITNELYLVSAQRVILAALDLGYHFVQTNLISSEELEIILAPLGKSQYYSTYADRFYPIFEEGSSWMGEKFMELTLLHLNLLMFADEMDFQLASSEERDKMLNELVGSEESEVRSRRVQIHSEELGGLEFHYARIGEELGGVATIVYIPRGGILYASPLRFVGISWKGIEYEIFLVKTSNLVSIRENEFTRRLIEGTEHILVIMPAVWTLLLYTQSLILTGPIGLVQAIVIDIVVEEVAERIDNKIIKLLVLFGGGRRSLGVSGVRGTILGAKEVLKGLGKTIRAVKAIRKRPKTTIPQAKVVKGGKGVKKPAKASDPKKIKEDRKIAARRRAMIILEERLKAVKQVDLGGPKTIEKVKINNTVTEVERELNGLETASLLFGGNLATFSKIAQHWPQELAKKYLNGLKNLREHLRKLKKTEEEIKEETKKFVENRWDTIRENFYKNIWKDKELVKELKKIGIIVRSGGRAPLLKIPGGKFVINLDHIRRKIEYPRDAFKLKNLRFATPLENSGLKEALEKSTKWPSTPVGSVNGPVSKLTKAEFDAMIDRLFEYEVQVKREWYVL